jgi:hypothetical protein
MPKGRYNGQKLMNDVSKKATANMPDMMANVPEMVFVKYKTPMITAMIMRITLSAAPIFFFIFVYFI